MVFDVASAFQLTGRQAELALREALFTVNRNTLPFDSNGPWYTSAIRVGTPAVTTVGIQEEEMKEIADCIVQLLKGTQPAVDEKGLSRSKVKIDPKVLASVRKRITALLAAYPLYPELVI